MLELEWYVIELPVLESLVCPDGVADNNENCGIKDVNEYNRSGFFGVWILY
jgi:hypothetical protein